MTKLTREEVNAFCDFLKDVIANTGYKDTNAERRKQIDGLRDMALESLDRDGVVVPDALKTLAQTVIDEEEIQCRRYRPSRELELAKFILLAAAPHPEPVPMGPAKLRVTD